jgi:hypothetical protein
MFDVKLHPPYDISAAPLCTSYNTASDLTLCLMKTIIVPSSREVAFQLVGNGNTLRMSVACRNHKARECDWPANMLSLSPLIRVHSDLLPHSPRFLSWPDDFININLLESNVWHVRFLFFKCECPIFLQLSDDDTQVMLAFSVPSE